MDIVKTKRVGCYGIVYNPKGEVLLIKKATGAYKGKLDLPGGGIEYGETTLEALKREFLEETGMKVKTSKLKTVVTHYEVWSYKDFKEDLSHYGIIFDVEVEDINKIKKDPDGRDSLGAQWYNVENLKIDELSPLAKCIKEN